RFSRDWSSDVCSSDLGYDRWESLGFDVAIYQPNYMFDTSLPKRRLYDAADRAYRLGMGIEIEANWTILSTEAGRERFRDYLWAGVKYGFMEHAVRAYYSGARSLGPGISEHRSGRARRVR